MKVFNLTIVLNNQVENIVVENVPQINDILIVNGVEVVVKKIVYINTIKDSMREIDYYTCICELNDIERIDVPQVKFMRKAEMEELLADLYRLHDESIKNSYRNLYYNK